MNYLTPLTIANSAVKWCADTFDPLRPTWIVKLHCGCTMTELVNLRQTKTSLEFSRDPTCRRLSHFTGDECGWPQIVDAVKATTLLSAASCERSDALATTKTLQQLRSGNNGVSSAK